MKFRALLSCWALCAQCPTAQTVAGRPHGSGRLSADYCDGPSVFYDRRLKNPPAQTMCHGARGQAGAIAPLNIRHVCHGLLLSCCWTACACCACCACSGLLQAPPPELLLPTDTRAAINTARLGGLATGLAFASATACGAAVNTERQLSGLQEIGGMRGR